MGDLGATFYLAMYREDRLIFPVYLLGSFLCQNNDSVAKDIIN
jgi:hypothetical protein